jgi:hypothetical protein
MLHDAPIIVTAVLVESVRPDITPQHCQKVGQRKFPGPAGLLPDKVGDAVVPLIKESR